MTTLDVFRAVACWVRPSALLLALILSFLGEVAAEACSCSGLSRVQPEDGAVDVPLNARLLVLAPGFDRVERVMLRRRDDGMPVALNVEDSVEASYAAALARPLPGLEPETTYEVVLDAIPAELVISTFTTGTMRDDVVPEFTGASGIRAQRWRADGTFFSSCWTRENGTDAVLVDHQAFGADIAGVIMEIWPQGDPSRSWRTIHPVPLYRAAWPGPGQTWLSSDSCSLTDAPMLDDPATYCVRVTAFDLAGNVAGSGAAVCAPSETCRITEAIKSVEPATTCDPTPFPPGPAPDGGSGSVADGGTATGSDSAGPSETDAGGGCTVVTGSPRAPLGMTLLLACLGIVLGRRAITARRNRK